ncbi:MAG: PAS domain S-box protein [bacterium]|jgi:PAS domain S-box-containing protein|nr:PAS domain S-box protein [bacterium]
MNRLYFLLFLYTLLSLLFGQLVIQEFTTDDILVLLVIPPIFSALFYPRWVYVSVILIGGAIAAWAKFHLMQTVGGSMDTVKMLFVVTLFISEIVHQAVRSRKLAEDTLHKKENHFRSIIENTLEIIFTIGRDGTILYANPSVKRYLDYEPFELKHQSFFAYVHPKDGDRMKEMFAWALENPGKAKLLEVRLQKKNAAWCWFETFIASHLDVPGIEAFVVHCRDITERKKIEYEKKGLEKELLHSQRIEAIGRVAGGIAHDFNNILSVITGYSQHILRTLSETSPLFSKIHEINKAAERGAALTRQLLAFSRKHPTYPTPVQINTIIQEFQGMLGRLLGDSIIMELRLDPQTTLIKADATQIEQVIMNVCLNARDAMQDGGYLTIQTQNIHLTEAEASHHIDAHSGPYVKLSITDTGHGMEEDVLTHIFEPFFTTKGKDKGTGLGLATTYGIVRQGAGFIHIQSEPQRGTQFDIYFPQWIESPHPGGEESLTTAPKQEETA